MDHKVGWLSCSNLVAMSCTAYHLLLCGISSVLS